MGPNAPYNRNLRPSPALAAKPLAWVWLLTPVLGPLRWAWLEILLVSACEAGSSEGAGWGYRVKRIQMPWLLPEAESGRGASRWRWSRGGGEARGAGSLQEQAPGVGATAPSRG